MPNPSDTSSEERIRRLRAAMGYRRQTASGNTITVSACCTPDVHQPPPLGPRIASRPPLTLSGWKAPISSTINPLTTNLVTPFLIQGPRFGDTPGAWKGIDYYINVDAVGTTYVIGGDGKAAGQQVFASMYAGTVGAPGDFSNNNTPPPLTIPYAGSCLADQPWGWLCEPGTVQPLGWGGISPNYSDAYLNSIKGPNSRVLACWGGYYADVMGLFGPSQPTGFPGINPDAADVVKSFLWNYCGITANNTNPLNWICENSTKTSSYKFKYDGLILDFENIGMGDPLNSYPIAPPANPPVLTGSAYTPYIAKISSIPSTYYNIAPHLFLGNAPASLSIVKDQGTSNVCACNTALGTWWPFNTATSPPGVSGNTYNASSSLALNHPAQLKYIDDIFVQFYNESADYYPGGQYFANLLACWGYVALTAQALGVKKTTINIGLACGDIIPGKDNKGNVVANGQGPTPPLGPQAGPPYTYWWPQYCTSGGTNGPNDTSASGWPNTSPKQDPINITNAIIAANGFLQTAFPGVKASDWLSGMGFWAGGNATLMANKIYDSQDPAAPTGLPAAQTYCWSDASYPAPDPLWTALGNIPVVPQ